MSTLEDTIAETVTISLTGTPIFIYGLTIDDGVRAFAYMDGVKAQPVTVAETITMTSTPSFVLGVVIAEHIVVGLSEITNHKFQLALADTLEALDAATVGFPVTISETVTISLAQLAQQAITIVEALGLTSTVVPIFAYGVTVTEAMALSAELTRFLGVSIDETITIAETLGGVAARSATIAETVTITEDLNPQLVLRVTIEDSVAFDDASILNMIYSSVISEAIEIAAAYLSPGDGITTWVMNSRTGSVTEYNNYAFNSFAKLGNKYLGASQDGLYELTGDDDAGETIIADIKSGFAQWAGTRFTMFKGIYLGIRGDGAFVFKLTTGDGKDYHYSVNVRDMRSTKVHLGKGLRARYFAFELISTGQDFDLDTIEFVPLVADRRV